MVAVMGSSVRTLTVSVSPNPVTGSGSGQSGATLSITSATATATASGGNGTYTYAWAYISGSSFTINSPSSAATTFTGSVVAGLNATITYTGIYRCTATDGNGVVGHYDETVSLSATGSGTPP